MLDVIFDLDQTLLDTVDYDPAATNTKRDFFTYTKQGQTYATYIRPHARELLAWCLAKHRVSVWTAGSVVYCNIILAKLLKPEERQIGRAHV